MLRVSDEAAFTTLPTASTHGGHKRRAGAEDTQGGNAGLAKRHLSVNAFSSGSHFYEFLVWLDDFIDIGKVQRLMVRVYNILIPHISFRSCTKSTNNNYVVLM